MLDHIVHCNMTNEMLYDISKVPNFLTNILITELLSSVCMGTDIHHISIQSLRCGQGTSSKGSLSWYGEDAFE